MKRARETVREMRENPNYRDRQRARERRRDRDQERRMDRRERERERERERRYEETREVARDRMADRERESAASRAYWEQQRDRAQSDFSRDRADLLRTWEDRSRQAQSAWESGRMGVLSDWEAARTEQKGFLDSIREASSGLLSQIIAAPSTVAQQAKIAYDEQLRAAQTTAAVTGRGVGGGQIQNLLNRQNVQGANLLTQTSAAMADENMQRLGMRRGLLDQQLGINRAGIALGVQDAQIKQGLAEKDFLFNRQLATEDATLKRGLAQYGADLSLRAGAADINATVSLSSMLDKSVTDMINVGNFGLRQQVANTQSRTADFNELNTRRQQQLAQDKFNFAQYAYDMDRRDQRRREEAIMDMQLNQGFNWGGGIGGGLAGAGAGAGAGAAIGSVVPGIGTAIGGAVGAGVGLLGGFFSGGSNNQTDWMQVMKASESLANRYGSGGFGYSGGGGGAFSGYYQPSSGGYYNPATATFGGSSNRQFWGL